MTPRKNKAAKVAKPKTPPQSPAAAAKAAVAKRSSPTKIGKGSPTKRRAPAKKTPPAKKKKEPDIADHSISSVIYHDNESPDETEDLTTLEGGPAGRAASLAYTQLDRTTNTHTAMLQVIRNFVTMEFFPYVKFVTSNYKMAFYDANAHPDTYCSVITKGCHLPPNINPINWWESVAKKEVRKKIHQLRSDRITALKWDYFGTSS
jgi:hypothetical protein